MVTYISSSAVFAAELSGKAKEELDKFQGTWVLERGEAGGKPSASEQVAQGKAVYKGDMVKMTVPHQGEVEELTVEIVKIDADANPKEFHFVRKNGTNAGKTMVAIYEFEGKDKYKWAFDASGKETLKEFKTEPNSSHVWNVWKREGTK